MPTSTVESSATTPEARASPRRVASRFPSMIYPAESAGAGAGLAAWLGVTSGCRGAAEGPGCRARAASGGAAAIVRIAVIKRGAARNVGVVVIDYDAVVPVESPRRPAQPNPP